MNVPRNTHRLVEEYGGLAVLTALLALIVLASAVIPGLAR